jgi:SAM-dependent methyltransferase
MAVVRREKDTRVAAPGSIRQDLGMDGFRDRIEAHYAPTIESYKRFWAPVLRAFAAPVFERLASETPGDSDRPLRGFDLGSGVGAHEAEIRRVLGPGSALVAGDVSAAMMRESRLAVPSSDPVRLDAARLPFPDGVFDVTFCLFVLHHIREQHRAMAECCRTLESRGRLAIVTWGAHDPGCRAFDLFEELLSEWGAPAKDPAPVPTWTENIDTPGSLRGLLESVGLDEVDCRRETVAYPWSPDALLGYRTGQGGTRRRLLELPESRQRSLIVEARKRLEALPEADLKWNPDVVYAVARRAAPGPGPR